MKRTFKIIQTVILLTGVFIFFESVYPYANHNRPKGLMTDLLSIPEYAVITNSQPHFSWIIPGEKSIQTAYQILVASDSTKLEENIGDMWDSGKIDSKNPISIPYKGKSLKENTPYWWKVRTWDQNKTASEYSFPQKFNTGDFEHVNRKWPGESRWVTIRENSKEKYVLENRHTIGYHEIEPASIVVNSKGNHFVTFEKAYFATIKLELGPVEKADTLIIHLGEKSTPSQEVDRNPGGSIIYQQAVLKLTPGVSNYILQLPRFVPRYPNSQVLPEHMPEVTPFRFVEIEGWEGELKVNQIKQYALLYPFNDNASYFHSSNDNLNQIWDLCKHTLKATPFLGMYIDGTRERMPYEADAYMQQVSHYCVDREFAIQRYTTDFLIYNPSWPTEWHLHIVLMAWADYMVTGDSRFLESRYDELKKKTLLALAREDGLISTRTGLVTPEFLKSIRYEGRDFRDIVDWPQGTPANETAHMSGHGSATLEGETDRFVFSDINTVVNAYHYRNLVLMEKIADVLNKTEDKRFFEKKASLVKSSFNEKLLNKKTKLYTDGEGVQHSALHANMFPVAFDLAPESNYPEIRSFLQSKGMACSPGMSLYLFEALYKLGAEDYALQLLTSEGDRSWMNMIRMGATMTTEAWDMKYKKNLTWTHAWGATPVYVISRRICGIEPVEPSFRKLCIKPQPGNLEWAKIKHPTIRGSVEVEFENKKNSFVLNVVIPPNSTADIFIPLKFDKYILLQNKKIVKGKKTDNYILIKDVEPGEYSFELKIA
jgi:hypothetical protein